MKTLSMVVNKIATGVVMAAVLTTMALAQAVSLPKELSGRWSFAGGGNSFSLEEIATSAEGFTARLTWWTLDSKCAIKKESIVGKVTESGIAFDAETKCGVAFSAELNRSEKQWTGKATTKSGVVVNMKAE